MQCPHNPLIIFHLRNIFHDVVVHNLVNNAGNAWAPPEWSIDNGWLQTVAVQGWAAEAKMLTPSLFPLFGSDALNGTDQDKMVVLQSVELLGVRKSDCNPKEQDCGAGGYAASPLIARGFQEDCGSDTNSSGICMHVVVANKDKIRPAKFTLAVQLPPTAHSESTATQPPLTSRLFGNGGYDIEFNCSKDCVDGVLEDWVGAAETVVYAIGCNGPRATKGQAWQSCANRRVGCDDFMWGCAHQPFVTEMTTQKRASDGSSTVASLLS